jgi:hypothetical protein
MQPVAGRDAAYHAWQGLRVATISREARLDEVNHRLRNAYGQHDAVCLIELYRICFQRA